VKVIDLRSDTLTMPTDEMRQAMFKAKVGDDVYSEDPTINMLEEKSAALLGKEAALFTASGTMSNLIAILAQTRPGDEIILGSEAHMLVAEVGGASALGGVVMRSIPNEVDGRLELALVEQTIREDNIHYPRTTLLCIENTQNRCGGTVLTAEYTAAVAELAHRHGLLVHLDGARIFNAAVALGIPARELTEPVDSVSFCLSKGLSAPVGSLLCGSSTFINSARKWRKMLGGGMRQAGIIAAAGIVAIEEMVDRLAEDHANAKALAIGLSKIPGIIIYPDRVQTNIVLFEPPTRYTPQEFSMKLEDRQILAKPYGGRRIRAVLNRMVSSEDIKETLDRVGQIVRESDQQD
jgi:threonine aldolase